MRETKFACLLILGSCGGSPGPISGPSADLQVTFAGEQSSVRGPVIADASSRMLIRAENDPVTVLLTLTLPITTGTLTLSSDNGGPIVWAKRRPETPLIATSGTISIRIDGDRFSVEIADALKPLDASGVELRLSGLIDGLALE